MTHHPEMDEIGCQYPPVPHEWTAVLAKNDRPTDRASNLRRLPRASSLMPTKSLPNQSTTRATPNLAYRKILKTFSAFEPKRPREGSIPGSFAPPRHPTGGFSRSKPPSEAVFCWAEFSNVSNGYGDIAETRLHPQKDWPTPPTAIFRPISLSFSPANGRSPF